MTETEWEKVNTLGSGILLSVLLHDKEKPTARRRRCRRNAPDTCPDLPAKLAYRGFCETFLQINICSKSYTKFV